MTNEEARTSENMTMEEVIDTLKGLVFGTFDRTTAKEREALDMVIKLLEQQFCYDIGEFSDGYHTFNQLYHQRAVLFACIVRQNKNKAWKSFKHSDGKYCFDSNGEWFIVGVDTPQGSYTYHYAKEYWDMFDCQELECGKEWDGHTEEDVNRLLSLEQQLCEDAISREDTLNKINALIADYIPLMPTGWTLPLNIAKTINELPSVTPSHEDLKEAYINGYDYGVKDWFKAKTEPCEDAISRKRLIILIDEGAELHPYKVVGDSETYSDYNQGWTDAFDWLYANIDCDNLPSVTPQPKTGHWITTRTFMHNGEFYCDKCKCDSPNNEKWDFCPNCGANMRGEKA